MTKFFHLCRAMKKVHDVDAPHLKLGGGNCLGRLCKNSGWQVKGFYNLESRGDLHYFNNRLVLLKRSGWVILL